MKGAIVVQQKRQIWLFTAVLTAGLALPGCHDNTQDDQVQNEQGPDSGEYGPYEPIPEEPEPGEYGPYEPIPEEPEPGEYGPDDQIQDTNPCAYAGDPLCPHTPLNIPGPLFPEW
jgi:hypothetical protein